MSIKSKLDYRYIYVLGNWAYPFRYKIGIARDVSKRVAGIDRSLSGKMYDIFWIKVLFAHQIEGFLHTLYSPLHARMKGSGYTEWFWMIFPVTPIILLIAVWVIQILLIPALVVGGFYWLFNVLSV
jgi:T5orf172 domain